MGKLGEAYVLIGAQEQPWWNSVKRVEAGARALVGKATGLLSGIRMPSLGGVGLFAALGLGAAATGLMTAINKAADLGETVSKVNVVFGSSAATVRDFANQMAKSFGSNKKEILDSVAMFGLMGKGIGMTSSEMAKFGIHFGKLAADVGSFDNAQLQEALEKIRAGLSGEMTPLKALGVMLDEETIKMYAYSAGIAKVGQELNQKQKFMIRSILITEELKVRIGDLEATEASGANQTRKFWGTLDNLQTTIGEALLPAFTEVITSLNEMLGGAEDTDSMFNTLVNTLRDSAENVLFVWRNAAEIFQLAQINAEEFVINTIERVTYFGEVVQEIVDYVGSYWSDMFIMAGNAVKNFATTAVAVFGEIYDYIASMGKNPIEFHIKYIPLDKGTQNRGLSDIAMKPLTDLSERREEALKAIEQTEGKHIDKRKEQANANAAQKDLEANKPMNKEAKIKKAETTDVEGFSKKLLEASLNGGGKEDKTVGAVNGVKGALDKLTEIVKKQTDDRKAVFAK